MQPVLIGVAKLARLLNKTYVVAYLPCRRQAGYCLAVRRGWYSVRWRGYVAAYGGTLARCGLYPRGCGCVRCRGCVSRGERGARKTAAAAAAVSPFRAPGEIEQMFRVDET